MEEKTFQVQDYGIISLTHSIWIHCKNLNIVNKMKIGDRHFLDFQSGAGKTVLEIIRVS